MKIFIIDDDQDMLEMMTVLLGQAGHSVDSCLSGAFALPKMAQQRPDVVITDLVMAEVDGLELVREIKGRDDLKAARVVMVSAKDADLWKSRALQAGAVGYITKPIDPATFVSQVEQIAR